MAIPNNYRLTNKEYYTKVPIGIAGWSFFLNTDAAVTETFANLRLSLFDRDGTEVLSNIASLSQVSITGGYRIYCEDITITSGVYPGQILRPVIYNTSTSAVVFLLKCIQFIGLGQLNQYTKVEFRHSTNIFNYNYEELPSFKNVYYLDLNRIDNPAEYELMQNSEATTGETILMKSQLKDTVVLESYFFDDDAHQMMKALSLHDDITIDGDVYEVKEGYKFEQNIRNSRAKGTIVLYDQASSTINLSS